MKKPEQLAKDAAKDPKAAEIQDVPSSGDQDHKNPSRAVPTRIFSRTFEFEGPRNYSKDPKPGLKQSTSCRWSHILSTKNEEDPTDIYLIEPGRQGVGPVAGCGGARRVGGGEHRRLRAARRGQGDGQLPDSL